MIIGLLRGGVKGEEMVGQFRQEKVRFTDVEDVVLQSLYSMFAASGFRPIVCAERFVVAPIGYIRYWRGIRRKINDHFPVGCLTLIRRIVETAV